MWGHWEKTASGADGGMRLVFPALWGACCRSGSEQPGASARRRCSFGHGVTAQQRGHVVGCGGEYFGITRDLFWDVQEGTKGGERDGYR